MSAAAQSTTASVDAHTLAESHPVAEVSEQPKLEKSDTKKSGSDVADESTDKEAQAVAEEEDESRFITGRKLVLVFVCAGTAHDDPRLVLT